MDYGIVLFTSDRGITPAAAAKLADDHGFTTFYVPEHTHIPVKRQAAHPTTGDESLPDDRYMRTLDPWVSLGTPAARNTTARMSTASAPRRPSPPASGCRPPGRGRSSPIPSRWRSRKQPSIPSLAAGEPWASD